MAVLYEPGLTCVVLYFDYILVRNINDISPDKVTYLLIFSIHN